MITTATLVFSIKSVHASVICIIRRKPRNPMFKYNRIFLYKEVLHQDLREFPVMACETSFGPEGCLLQYPRGHGRRAPPYGDYSLL